MSHMPGLNPAHDERPDSPFNQRAAELAGRAAPPAPSVNAARIDMVHELHTALYGDSWARGETPKQVWEMLLNRVHDLAAGAAPPAPPEREAFSEFEIREGDAEERERQERADRTAPPATLAASLLDEIVPLLAYEIRDMDADLYNRAVLAISADGVARAERALNEANEERAQGHVVTVRPDGSIFDASVHRSAAPPAPPDALAAKDAEIERLVLSIKDEHAFRHTKGVPFAQCNSALCVVARAAPPAIPPRPPAHYEFVLKAAAAQLDESRATAARLAEALRALTVAIDESPIGPDWWDAPEYREAKRAVAEYDDAKHHL